MANYLVVLLFFAIIAISAAKPVPDYDEDGQELLKSTDTRYSDLPLFWYRRPFRGDDGEDYGANGGGYAKPLRRNRRPSIPLYERAGAGWGR